jgi:hypothetical protein
LVERLERLFEPWRSGGYEGFVFNWCPEPDFPFDHEWGGRLVEDGPAVVRLGYTRLSWPRGSHGPEPIEESEIEWGYHNAGRELLVYLSADGVGEFDLADPSWPDQVLEFVRQTYSGPT